MICVSGDWIQRQIIISAREYGTQSLYMVQQAPRTGTELIMNIAGT